MNAQVDKEVKKHLEAMHRERVVHEVRAVSTQRGTRAMNYFDPPFSTANKTGEMEQEETLQPRRLSLCVF